jgi:hypothetical protein
MITGNASVNSLKEQPSFELYDPAFVLMLLLTPLLLMFTPTLPPIRALGLEIRTPFDVNLTRGLLIENGFDISFSFQKALTCGLCSRHGHFTTTGATYIHAS